MLVTRRRRLLPSVAVTVFLGLLVVFAVVAGREPARVDAAAQRPWPVIGTLPPPATARAAIVIDGATGTILFDKNARQSLAPASLTKIVTAMIVLERIDLHRKVAVRLTPGELDPDSTLMGLRSGDQVTVEDLLHGLLLSSGNDAALVLARTVSGSEAAFVELMNATVRGYGLRGTRFVNSHGLDARGHQTTAQDIAQLARLAMRDARFRRIVAAEAWTVRGQRTYTLRNRNAFLRAYLGADGIKTGWTDAAGATIVASATRNGHGLIVALLDTRDRIGDSAALLDWAFRTFRWPDQAPVSAAASR